MKISFQAVSGQKVEKESDGDKTEILIPHPMVSKRVACSHLTHYNRALYPLNVHRWSLWNAMPAVCPAGSPACSVRRAACTCSVMSSSKGIFFFFFLTASIDIWLGTKTCHCCDAFLCASALCARLMQVIPMCKNACSLIRAALGGDLPPPPKSHNVPI